MFVAAHVTVMEMLRVLRRRPAQSVEEAVRFIPFRILHLEDSKALQHVLIAEEQVKLLIPRALIAMEPVR